MQALDDIVKKAGEYPKHQTYHDVHPFDLDRYFDQLGALDKKLFHESRRSSFDFWEYSSATESQHDKACPSPRC